MASLYYQSKESLQAWQEGEDVRGRKVIDGGVQGSLNQIKCDPGQYFPTKIIKNSGGSGAFGSQGQYFS